MIINHNHRFCFFAIPRTASTAVSQLLVERYGSQRILRRHASYKTFMAQASSEERDYFKFASVRNPLDSVVSAYFKKRSDHNGRFSRGASKHGKPLSAQQIAEYDFIQRGASFAEYFAKFFTTTYRLPVHEHTVGEMDRVLRFEQLQSDLAGVLSTLGLAPHPIPTVNRTEKGSRNFESLYVPEVIPQAKRVFSPLMKAWGYEFPSSWSRM